ncbi:MAG: hypothetical protein L0241_09915, partial [Planctomycetia bacterium]|nr:hypothetical protein [Planctomycetia bacterium]
MSRVIRFAVLALMLSMPLGSTVADYHPCQGIKVPSPPPKVRESNGASNSYGGIVTAVTKDSITIQWVNAPDVPPKTFAVSETLAAGKVPVERRKFPGQTLPGNPMMPEYMYRLTDVKVGDCVGIFYARINGVDICDHIRISRRPDGEVPPLPKEAEDLRDERKVWQAKNPGKPLPEHFGKAPYQ